MTAAPAQAHHTQCTWGADVQVSFAEGDPLVRHAPPLAMWGCDGPVVWATVVDGNGNQTFVPLYGQGPAPRDAGAPASTADPAPAQQPRTKTERARRAKRPCKTRRARSARRAKARCQRRSATRNRGRRR